MSGALRQFTARQRDTGFDPLSIGWHAAFYADDLARSDGASVATWSDSSGNSRDATAPSPAQEPTLRLSDAAMGGEPTVKFDGIDDYMSTTAFASLLPFTFVVVGRTRQVDGNLPFVAGTWDGSSGSPPGLIREFDNRFAIFNGTSRSVTFSDTDAHIFIVEFAAGNDTAQVDSLETSKSAGDKAAVGVGLGRFSSLNGPVDLSFVGLLDGTLTSQEKSDLLAWSQDKYGTP